MNANQQTAVIWYWVACVDFVKHSCRLSITYVDCYQGCKAVKTTADTVLFFTYQKGVLECVCVCIINWYCEAVKGINGYVKHTCVSVSCVISHRAQFAMRQEPIGGSHEGPRGWRWELRLKPCENMSSVCTYVHVYTGMDVSAASQGHSFEELP